MELELKDFFRILAKRIWFICGVVVMICGIAVTYHYLYSKPVYVASTKLIVTSVNHDRGLGVPDSNEISSNMMLIGTYKEIIASTAILDKVLLEHPDITLDVNQLVSGVKVVSSSGSQVINVSLSDTSFEQAVITVNAIAQMFKREIPQIMNVDNVTILSEARMTEQPAPVSHGLIFKLVIAFILSLMCSVGIVMIWEYLDDTIKTEKDVLQYLRQPTLGVITKIKKSEINKVYLKKNRAGDNIHVSINQQV
ncbi:YveK family protein [Cohnella sp. WQ 127256]|uniref:YveK family protein n=1 Tax=Cohnella sp. WQ 127256 TaxID=2938790 RepID=UPI002117B5F5|nr:Wzz/FepE/Etk N-terminal domain-containing protein [Cohnella sp. WQ 127256]